jgi:hypothetical protein
MAVSVNSSAASWRVLLGEGPHDEVLDTNIVGSLSDRVETVSDRDEGLREVLLNVGVKPLVLRVGVPF